MVNARLCELYSKLECSLRESDGSFLEHGKRAVRDYAFHNGYLRSDVVEGIEFDDPGKCYSRRKILGDEGKHVILDMNWSPDFSLFAHEHGKRPCIMLIVEGHMYVTDFEAVRITHDKYQLNEIGHHELFPGDIGTVDPVGDIHSMDVITPSKTLHFYAEDRKSCFGYLKPKDQAQDDGLFFRKEFQLQG